MPLIQTLPATKLAKRTRQMEDGIGLNRLRAECCAAFSGHHQLWAVAWFTTLADHPTRSNRLLRTPIGWPGIGEEVTTVA